MTKTQNYQELKPSLIIIMPRSRWIIYGCNWTKTEEIKIQLLKKMEVPTWTTPLVHKDFLKNSWNNLMNEVSILFRLQMKREKHFPTRLTKR